MPERRYDEDETRRIFDEASQVRSLTSGASAAGGGGGGEGFTLAELQDIAAEAGLDPARVAEAARALDAPAAGSAVPAVTRRVAGLPMGVARTVQLPAGFDDDAWNRLVVDLRETFDARGTLRTQGDFREWSNGNLQALVEPWEDGYRLRLSTVKGSAQRMLGAGGMLLTMATILAVVLVLLGESVSVSGLAGPLFMALLALGFGVMTAVPLPAWARTRARQMEEVAARAALPPPAGD